MVNILKNNSYHILGLDASATQQDVLKRSKEISNLLKIDEYPHYDLDIDLFKDLRTEESVREAVQKLQNPKKRIKEYFFWFQVMNSFDEQAFGSIQAKDYQKAIQVWRKASEDNTKAHFYKKNLAVLYGLLLLVENNKDYLENSITLWKEIVDSDKFWTTFSKFYKLHDEQTSSQDIVDDFKNHIVTYLSDMYADLHQIHSDVDYINEFQKSFSARGEKIEKNVLGPVYQTINIAAEELEKMNVSEDGILDDQERKNIKKQITIIQVEFNKLIDLGMYDDSRSKIMRDRVANALRGMVLDMHNNLDEIELSKKLLEIGITFCGTESLKSKLTQDLEQIEKNLQDSDSQFKLEIPGFFSSSDVIFMNNTLEYKGKKIFYRDVTKVSWHSVRNSTNGIPTGQTYSFSIATNKDVIKISYTAAFRGGEKHNDLFAKLVNISNTIIEPIIVEKLMAEIFNSGNTITIGSLKINRRGIHRKKFFGGIEEVLWPNVEYKPSLHQGQVEVFKKNKKGEAAVFMSIPMETDNAVILPELFVECINFV